ncbi:DUF6443 domain-containing protein [Chitinophaga sp. XS-30]|uniref:DUF6443 domain-containing protein n=1 Tax=Chitinophaga sp. XS-30 TaxID=2604421 RepID=UPI0011DCA0B1|nr:DUF6443 domain-containing protein [Chitinophaga sp. XS-30]QEH42708.1 hypothetical protein FW415_18230 [Chitinophaga sp. XS-30]
MHKISYCILQWLLTTLLAILNLIVYSQTPGGPARPSATPVTQPSAYTNPTLNYIRTWEPSKPMTDPVAVISTANPVADVKQSTQYFDGLGRPLQTVSKGISPAGRDLVAPVVYDAFGREQFQYLPYVPQSGNMSDGLFKTSPFAGQAAFYNNKTSLHPGLMGDTIYYSRTDYEASPLNRVLSTYAPGNSWAKEGGNRPVKMDYLVNTAADSVRIWTMPTSGTIPTSTATYGAGQLYKNVTTDERGGKVVEYKDKEGQVVLKKVQLAASPGTAHAGWLCTYYVYDDLNNLRFVIPPLAVERINSNWNVSTVAAGLCFQYQYDHRQRMIEKRVPGAGPVQMVYDNRDRLVFTQDSAQRAKAPTKEWLVTFYDGLNRPVMTALYSSNATRAQLQDTMNTATGSSSQSYAVPGPTDLVLGQRVAGITSYKARNSITFQDGFESETGAEFLAEIDPTLTTGTTTVTVTNPLPDITGYEPLTYTYYDDYTYTGAKAYTAADTGKLPRVAAQYPEPLIASPMTRGMVTGRSTGAGD